MKKKVEEEEEDADWTEEEETDWEASEAEEYRKAGRKVVSSTKKASFHGFSRANHGESSRDE